MHDLYQMIDQKSVAPTALLMSKIWGAGKLPPPPQLDETLACYCDFEQVTLSPLLQYTYM